MRCSKCSRTSFHADWPLTDGKRLCGQCSADELGRLRAIERRLVRDLSIAIKGLAAATAAKET